MLKVRDYHSASTSSGPQQMDKEYTGSRIVGIFLSRSSWSIGRHHCMRPCYAKAEMTIHWGLWRLRHVPNQSCYEPVLVPNFNNSLSFCSVVAIAVRLEVGNRRQPCPHSSSAGLMPRSWQSCRRPMKKHGVFAMVHLVSAKLYSAMAANLFICVCLASARSCLKLIGSDLIWNLINTLMSSRLFQSLNAYPQMSFPFLSLLLPHPVLSKSSRTCPFNWNDKTNLPCRTFEDDYCALQCFANALESAS